MKKIILLMIFVCIMNFGGCAFLNNMHYISADNILSDVENEKPEDKVQDPLEIKISAVGDIMVHGPQLRAQYNQNKEEYNFKNNFQFVKPYISQADIALCNLETTFGGVNKGYSSFPKFNTPDSLGEAIKDAGFDAVITANNHTIDSGGKGVFRTIKELKKLGLDVVGTKENEACENFIVKKVKNVKFGIIAYTYETPKWGNHKTLNSLIVPKEVESCINTFNYANVDEDLKKMKKEIQRMREQGVEVIIFYLHWGNEYHREPNKYQKKIAQYLTDVGVDIIFGSHPHVLQPIEFMENENRKKKTLVVYSMGNFLSNQRYEILKNRYTEDGIILNITLLKDFEKNLITIKEVAYVPTWVHKYFKNGRKVYEIIPLNDALDNPTIYHLLNKDSLWRAKNSKNNTTILIESETNEKIYQTPPISNAENNKITGNM
ncbi:CapA family protein [Crassaminicella thermophila]|nr:CapA family protein [Crassaminicella thermophila]